MPIFNSNTHHSAKVSEFHVGGAVLPIHMPTFWSLECTSHIHKGHEAISSLPEVTGYSASDPFVRHADPTPDQRETPQVEINSTGSFGEPWISHQLQEVRVRTNSVPDFLGFSNKLGADGNKSAEGEGQSSNPGGLELEKWPCFGKATSTLDIGVHLNSPSNFPLHYRGLQNLKHQILKRGGYDAILQLSDEARDDLVWWTENLPLVNGQPLVREQPSLQIESDVSLKGWGAVCEGEQIDGPWAEGEKNLHINCLELLAASHAV